MLTDFRNSDVLREQLVDLSKISTSMMGGMKLDKSPDTASSEVRTVYWIVTGARKLL